MDWMSISGYRLPQQLNSNNPSVNGLSSLKEASTTSTTGPRDNSSATQADVTASSSTMLDMWAASKVEAASNSSSSSNLGGSPTTPPIPMTGGDGGGVRTPSDRTGSGSSISTPGSIKGLRCLACFNVS